MMLTPSDDAERTFVVIWLFKFSYPKTSPDLARRHQGRRCAHHFILIIHFTILILAATQDFCYGATNENPGFKSSLLAKPADWNGNAEDLFIANYDFPATMVDTSQKPYLILDPRNPSERSEYYKYIVKYGLTAFTKDIGNGCPKVSSNWYHVPWLTTGGAIKDSIQNKQIGSGREPICGLTQERPAPIGFLHANQKRSVQNWAVGMFNAPGGYLLGRVWRDRDKVDLSETTFPIGTFVIKYLFTEATVSEVPYLAGSPEWNANIYEQTGDNTSARKTKPMRLTQIDFGIRDKRMENETGWVYGTFLYYNVSDIRGADWTMNLVPVGLMWGNDPDITTVAKFKEQSLSTEVVQLRDSGKLFDLKVRKEFGWMDRVNGPIDNPVSSCLSCHSTAQVHRQKVIKHFLTPALVRKEDTVKNRMLWFRNTKAGKTFMFNPDDLKRLNQGRRNTIRADWTPDLMKDFVSTDYSLQLRMAIENMRLYALGEALDTVQVLTTKPSFTARASRF